MKAKLRKQYICSNCGAESPSWSGRCHVCGEWNTLEEEVIKNPSDVQSSSTDTQLKTKRINQVVNTKESRIPVNYGDVDRVFGGGLVQGSIVLLAGEPGIGKSTLLLQISAAVAHSKSVLYVSGEESANQVGLRAQRLGLENDLLELVHATNTDDIAYTIINGSFDLVIVDSIQTLQCNQVNSAAGSVGQISSSTHLLLAAAKNTNTCVILVGHVTKEGAIAGPKVLEHIVDGVFQLEGDKYGGFKALRSMKNRYGPTHESAIFEMKDVGLKPVSNPSKALLAERQPIDGSIVLASIEGSRPLLVEVQALVTPSTYGYPRRTASGIDQNRLNVLAAMLERRTKLKLSDKDIFVNIVGGLRVQEPAADLAVCLAIGSSTKGLTLKEQAVVFGEVGLAGEVRHVHFAEARINEAKKLGFTMAIGPKQSGIKGNYLKPVKDVRTALNTFLQD